ncbi:LURP-one-related/scramblase family protein [Streptococcus castoreus]|uniref:LURP-one-related/scramblase family protein n=1 Tax=Streptococcus castoreus TaxID=254786 RepID=UPI0003FBA862|nr:LURP-one-related family protein [Streptococcus castoreus]
MKTFQIKEKMWSLGGTFTITDDLGIPCYRVEGSFLSIPKTFTILDMQGNQVSHIEKNFLTFLPKFEISLANGQQFFIEKDFTLFKPHYTIKNLNMEVQGDFWDMDFSLLVNGRAVAEISQEWFRMTSTYNITVYDDTYSDLTISLVIAIDYVKELERNSK